MQDRVYFPIAYDIIGMRPFLQLTTRQNLALLKKAYMNRHTLTHTHCGHVGYYNKLPSPNI